MKELELLGYPPTCSNEEDPDGNLDIISLVKKRFRAGIKNFTVNVKCFDIWFCMDDSDIPHCLWTFYFILQINWEELVRGYWKVNTALWQRFLNWSRREGQFAPNSLQETKICFEGSLFSLSMHWRICRTDLFSPETFWSRHDFQHTVCFDRKLLSQKTINKKGAFIHSSYTLR